LYTPPFAGNVIDAVGADRSITHVYEAAELVPVVTARTWNVCDPAASPEYDFDPVVPEPHDANELPSSEHWNVTDDVSVYWKLADCDDVGFAGFDEFTIIGTGGAGAPNPTAAHTPNPAASTPNRTTINAALDVLCRFQLIPYGPVCR
jgi:hypothetical protein